eukprot:768471-Hanusia_phi.AAC.2
MASPPRCQHQQAPEGKSSCSTCFPGSPGQTERQQPSALPCPAAPNLRPARGITASGSGAATHKNGFLGGSCQDLIGSSKEHQYLRAPASSAPRSVMVKLTCLSFKFSDLRSVSSLIFFVPAVIFWRSGGTPVRAKSYVRSDKRRTGEGRKWEGRIGFKGASATLPVP